MNVGISQIQQWINDCSESDHCWLSGFLQTVLNKKIVWYPMEFSNVGLNDVVMFYDENWQIFNHDRNLTSDELDQLTPAVVLTISRARHHELLTNGIRSVYVPYAHWFFNLIPMRKLHQTIKKNNRSKVFNFLNRAWNPGRLHLIEYILKQYPEITKQGYITANTFSYYNSHPNFYKDQEFNNFYIAQQAPIEHNNFQINGVSVTSNIKNFFYIAENIPGTVSIQVETFTQEKELHSFITEKSLQALATQQIPIIIGSHPNFIQTWLKDFDIFNDIVDHSYDVNPDYYQRLESAIDLNYELLSGQFSMPNFDQRFEHNQNYLFGRWTDENLLELVRDILNALEETP